MVGAVAGIVALQWLLAPLTTPAAAPPVVDDAVPASGAAHADERVVDRLREALGSGGHKGAALDRRRFFLTGGVALGVAAVAGGAGRLLQRRFDVAEARAGLALPGRRPRPSQRSPGGPTCPARSRA